MQHEYSYLRSVCIPYVQFAFPGNREGGGGSQFPGAGVSLWRLCPSTYSIRVPIPVITAMVSAALPCKAKRQYLLTLQVSRYCLLALQSSAAVASTNNAAVVTPCVSN